jgi:hypothetical protein
MAQTAYFGNTSYAAFVKTPQSGMAANPVGYSSRMDFLNGGASVRRSNRSHREFNMSWSGQMNGTDTTENLQIIKDFYDGLYGDGPFYWLDPFAMASNVLPPHYAAPMLSELDWPSLSATVTPTFVANSYANGYPIKRAAYSLPAGHSDTRKLTILIPPNFDLHFGWHSTSAGVNAGTAAGVQILPYYRSTGAPYPVINPSSALAGGTTRIGVILSGNTYSHVEIYLANGGASTSVANIVGMIAQVIPNTSTVPSGGFISGRGTTQLEFSEAPTINYISSAINNGFIEMSANFVEVV